MMKTKQNASLVMKEMDVTFAFRRKEVVKNKPPIVKMLQRWPALFTESQVYCELNRVVGKGLRENFFDALDHFSPSLMDLFGKKRGLTSQILADLLHKTKVNEPTDNRCLILRGLPVILGDDPTAFFRNCSDVGWNGSYSQTAVGILCMDEDNPQLNPSPALHLDYPKYMKNSFNFFQQVMLDLGRSELTPKIQTLKNQPAV